MYVGLIHSFGLRGHNGTPNHPLRRSADGRLAGREVSLPMNKSARAPIPPTTLEDTMFLVQVQTSAYTMVYVMSPNSVKLYRADPLGWCTRRVERSRQGPERHNIITLNVRRYTMDKEFLDRPDTLGGTGSVQD